MNASEYWLFFLEGIALLAAIGILFSRNILYAALSLILLLLCFAAIYILLQAEFLAVSQILIYAGGVLVLILFGIMLTARQTGKPLLITSYNLPGGIILGACTLLLLFYALQNSALDLQNNAIPNNTQAVGYSLMSDFVAPFEVAGILLLVSLVGAIVSASNSKAS